MPEIRVLRGVPRALVLALACGMAGCGEAEKPAAVAAGSPQAASTTPDWCSEHGVPESVCTRCNASLIAAFKAKKDWCTEHTLPESQCVPCHPELAAKFKAMAPRRTGP